MKFKKKHFYGNLYEFVHLTRPLQADRGERGDSKIQVSITFIGLIAHIEECLFSKESVGLLNISSKALLVPSYG